MTNLPETQSNSEIILYQTEDGQTRIQVRLQNETVWLSLNQMAELFQRDKSVISRHIKNIFSEGELKPEAVVANFATTAADGKSYQVGYYNLDVIISVGYRVKSHRGTQFRIWAAHGHTAAEIVASRADSGKPNMGLTSWADDRPRKADIGIAKNYLHKDELDILNRIVNFYLEFAELQTLNRKPMYMRDWIAKLDDFLRISERDILTHTGKISHDKAIKKAQAEYEKYREIQINSPSPVAQHFAEAVKDIKRLEKEMKPRMGTKGKL